MFCCFKKDLHLFPFKQIITLSIGAEFSTLERFVHIFLITGSVQVLPWRQDRCSFVWVRDLARTCSGVLNKKAGEDCGRHGNWACKVSALTGPVRWGHCFLFHSPSIPFGLGSGSRGLAFRLTFVEAYCVPGVEPELCAQVIGPCPSETQHNRDFLLLLTYTYRIWSKKRSLFHPGWHLPFWGCVSWST